MKINLFIILKKYFKQRNMNELKRKIIKEKKNKYGKK